MFKRYILRIINNLFLKSKYKMSSFGDYSEYIIIQYRCAPKEFLDSRLKIVSSFVFTLPALDRRSISNPVTC